MKLAKRKEPKVQRGISLEKALYDRIQKDADRLSLSWNEVAEAMLVTAYKDAPDSSKVVANSIESGDEVTGDGLFD